MTTEEIDLAGVTVTVTKPYNPPVGVTFLLPGSMISVSEYESTRDVLISMDRWVLSFYINVLRPIKNNHREQSHKVRRVFDAFRAYHTEVPNSYGLVGHSVGAQVCLLVASITDPLRVDAVVALDPVDQLPTEFTNDDGGDDNLPLDGTGSGPVTMTLTDGGRGISKDHDAGAIHGKNPGTSLVRHEHAGHLAYTDRGGGRVARWMMPDVGTKEGNDAAREDAHRLVRDIIGKRRRAAE